MTLVTSTLVAAQPITPPVAPVRPHVVQGPQGERIDEYHWLRDDDARAKRPEIMQYLEAENAYTDAMLAPLADLRRQLVAEMRERMVEDDSTPPVYDQGWWYWTEFKAGDEYPRLMRQRGTPERPDTKAPRLLLLDQPARARAGLLQGGLHRRQPRRPLAGLDGGHRRPPHAHAALARPCHRPGPRRCDTRRA